MLNGLSGHLITGRSLGTVKQKTTGEENDAKRKEDTKEENRAHELTKKNREKIARGKEQHAQKEADRRQKYKEKKAR